MGNVSAYIESRSGGIDLVVTDNTGTTVATLDSSKTLNRRNKINFDSNSGIYTFKISSKDKVTNRKGYYLRISYPVKSSESPTAIITSPQENESLSNTVSFGATATDDIGITKVEFYLGTQLLATDTKSPYVTEWDTTNTRNGSVTLVVRSYDLDNNMGQASISVDVNNNSSTPTEPEPTNPDIPTTPAPDPTVPNPDPFTPTPDEPAPIPEPTTSQFFEGFNGNTGLSRFNTGIYHRGDSVGGSPWPGARTWSGDHDMNCGSPDTQRTIHRDNKMESFYVCRDHLMTSIGDTDGYSTGYFSPKQSFSSARTVSWDVNMTDLGSRQWWEVLIVPTSFSSGVSSCPQCAVIDFLSPSPSGLPSYPNGSIMVGNGPAGKDIKVIVNGVDQNVRQYYSYCSFDSEGCASKAIRRPFKITDNGNGTITVNYAGVETYTVRGSFPSGGFNVVFKDHNYTPDKDGIPVGHTWHWDNIEVR